MKLKGVSTEEQTATGHAINRSEFCVAGGAGENLTAAVFGVVVEPGKDAVELAVREAGLELDRHAGGAEVEPAGIRAVVVGLIINTWFCGAVG